MPGQAAFRQAESASRLVNTLLSAVGADPAAEDDEKDLTGQSLAL
jgi:hypothetical protein